METWQVGSWRVFLEGVQAAVKSASLKLDRSGYFGLKQIGPGGDYVLEPYMEGQITDGREVGRNIFCQEKTTRLETQRNYFGHDSSWQSREPSLHRWGGAVVGHHDEFGFIFSFESGDEMCDEAIALLAAMEVGCLSHSEAIHIANISGNTIFLRCLTEIATPMERALEMAFQFVEQHMEGE